MSLGQFVADLSWTDLEACIQSGHSAILPIGAQSKEHGKHLPLSTDAIQVEWVCRQLVCDYSVLIWPTIAYGYYPAFTDFPGHSSLSQQTFKLQLEEVCQSILHNGHSCCFLLNSGISTIATVDQLASSTKNIKAIHIYSGKRFQQAVKDCSTQHGGGHADEVETSIMLHIAPDKVRQELSVNESSTVFRPGPLNRHNADADNYTASGAMGNPTLATALKGQLLVAAMLEDVREQLAS
ncbi:MAG: creatinine amidohydrolase [Parasphingorhabdus sp.]|jgi:creatinine amidohydrolase